MSEEQVKFSDYGLDEEIIRALEVLKYVDPTEVQRKVIPVALKAQDLIVKSQTGSGKTAAFAIPLCELADWAENKPQALVLTPTRELAQQVRRGYYEHRALQADQGGSAVRQAAFCPAEAGADPEDTCGRRHAGPCI